jgi:hypothetical protein
MMYTDMPAGMGSSSALDFEAVRFSNYLPLKVIRPGIFMFSFRTKRAHIAWRVVHQTVPDHLILALEPFASLAAWTTWHGTVVRTCRGVNIGVRI